MAVRIFIFVLLVVSIISVFAPIDNSTNKLIQKDIALISFSDSTNYTLNDIEVTRIVESTNAVRYKSRDEMFNGTFYLRSKSKRISNLPDIISADFIEKKGSKLKFVKNVDYNRDDFMTLKTEILYYNLDSKIAYNDKPFIATYYGDLLTGSELYMDTSKTYFKSQKAHFEINLDNKE